jgi:hypothetical protein
MAIDKEVKKNVIEDWRNAFPQLTLYAQNKLYKMVGPVIIGLELIKLPRTEEYRPYFVMYSLWGNNIKICLDYPIVLEEFKDKRGLQYDIPYERHNSFFNNVLESINKQTLLPFDGNISLKKLLLVMDEYSKTPPLSAAPNSYLQAVVQEAKLKIALFINAPKAQSVLDQINKRNWDITHFKACGVDISKWLQGLQETISNRDEFIKQIAINKQDKKICLLKSSELTA